MSRCPLPQFQDRWVDPEEAAEILGVSLQSIRQDTVQGQLGLPRFRFGRRVRFKLSEMAARQGTATSATSHDHRSQHSAVTARKHEPQERQL